MKPPEHVSRATPLLALLLLAACLLSFLAGMLPVLDFAYTAYVLPGLLVAAFLLWWLLIRPLVAGLAARALLEDSLRRRARETEDLYDRAPCGYHSLDADGRLLRINQTALDWLGYRGEELLGRPFRDLLADGCRGLFDAALPALATTGGGVRDLELDLVRKDGSLLPILMGAVAVTGEDGSFLHSRGTFIDLTGRKEAEARLAELNARLNGVLAAATEVAIFATNLDGRMRLFNPGAERMFGKAAAEMLGREPPWGLGLEAEGFAAMTGRAREEGRDQREWALARRDGTRLDLSTAITAMRDVEGRPSGFLFVALDVTARKQAAEQLRRARDEAESANEAKSRFLATMSHELRTPLAGILGMAEILSRTPLDPGQRKNLTSLTRSAEGLLGLLNGILDLSKVEAGKIELERIPIRLEDLVSEAIAVLAPEIGRKGLRLVRSLSPALPPRVLGDPGRLRQVLLNLLGNAVKFTDAGEVELSAAPEGEGVAFRVRDTGVGIPADRLTRIFDPFAQASASTSRTHGGTGLGLAISARLVEIMGGRLHVSSRPGEGSTFGFTIPLPTAEGVPGSATGEGSRPDIPPPPTAGPLRVLVAEDTQINRDVLTMMLQQMGCRPEVVEDGGLAVERAERERFDVILMDIQMPEVDGLRATRLIRAREKALGRHTPIVAVTANAMQGERERCLAAGMDGYLTKPIRPQELAEVLRRHGGGPVTPLSPTVGRPNSDWEANLNVMGFDRDAIRRLARTFLDTVPGRLETMRQAARGGDAARLASAAHTLRGALTVFGAKDAIAVAAALEESARAGRMPEAGDALERLESLAGPLVNSLTAFLG